MTTLPKYIKEMISEGRLAIANYWGSTEYTGYTFRLTQRFKTKFDNRFEKDLNKLVAFCNRYTDATILKRYDAPKLRMHKAIIGTFDPIARLIEDEINNNNK